MYLQTRTVFQMCSACKLYDSFPPIPPLVACGMRKKPVWVQTMYIETILKIDLHKRLEGWMEIVCFACICLQDSSSGFLKCSTKPCH